MNIISISASHHDLELTELEALGTGARTLGPTLVSRCAAVEGVVVLSTCNRFEVYVETSPVLRLDDRAGLDQIAEQLTALAAGSTVVETGRSAPPLRVRTGADAVHHLFRVASGLDSMIVGEREIAGQVRRALSTARELGVTSTGLEHVFQAASRVSRRVEAETGLGSAGRSVVSVGLDLVGADAPPWRSARVLLIGTGSYAGASLAALRARGCRDVRVYSRSGRAAAFAASRGADVVPEGELIPALADADVVVSCSGNIGTVLDAAAVAAARERAAADAGARAHAPDPQPRPLVILDLALRRDVAVDVSDVEGVLHLDLTTIQRSAPQAGPEPVREAERIIADGVVAVRRRAVERRAVARIAALRADARRRMDAELAGLADGTAPDPRTERAVRRRIGAELHEQIMAAKQSVLR